MRWLRLKFIDIVIYLIEWELSSYPKESISEEAENGLLAMMWDNPAFRNYINARNQKLIYSIAGSVGTQPEPRDKFLMKHGQRVENLFFASKAKAAAARRDRAMTEKKSLAKAQG